MRAARALWVFVLPTLRLYWLDFVLQVFRAGILLVPGLVVLLVFDRLSNHAPVTAGYWGLLALLVGAAIARVTALLSCVAVDAMCSGKGQSLLIRNVLGRFISRRVSRADRPVVGDVLNRLTTDTATVAGLPYNTLLVAACGVQALVAVCIMLSIDPLATAVMLIPLVTAGIVITVGSARIKNFHRASREAAGATSGYIRDVLAGIQVVQLSGASPDVLRRLRLLNDARKKSALQSMLFTNVFLASVWNNASNLAMGIVLIIVAHDFKLGQFTVGDLALFVAYVGWTTDFVALLGQNLAQYKQATVSLERLADALPGRPPVSQVVRYHRTSRSASRQSLVTLRARGLTFHHPGSARGVEGVDLDIERGSLMVVTGRVGAGKSTLLRCLLGLLPLEDGTIWWNGEEVRRPDRFFVPPNTAYTPQVPSLTSDTIRDNILLGLDAPPDALDRAVHRAVLDADLSSFGEGLETVIGPRGIKVSGGQRQRIAAARMLVREPELLVFDDLSSDLDIETEEALWERLGEMPGQTYLAVSHHRAALRRADSILVLRDGRVAAQGSLTDLLRHNPEIQQIWADIDHASEHSGASLSGESA